MKVMTILGTRPEIIRLSRIIPRLDQLCEHVLVHTGQNYDRKLHDIFFEEMEIRSPDHVLACKSDTAMMQIGIILSECERIILREKPDRLLILGDTNSALSSIVGKRMNIPVYHMEAGNRCYDDRVPEEVNRRIVDHCSDVLMPYTERSRSNLLREGIENQRIYVTGNPINEVIRYYDAKISNATILSTLNLKKNNYFLVTMHREENVDDAIRLRNLNRALVLIQKEYNKPVICSVHPRTRKRMESAGMDVKKKKIYFHPPFGFFDFVHLEHNAFCVLSDSGTVQEECCIFKVPNVTIRDVTERPETIECGSNILSGTEPENILYSIRTVLNQKYAWIVPKEYTRENVSSTVIKILLGYR